MMTDTRLTKDEERQLYDYIGTIAGLIDLTTRHGLKPLMQCNVSQDAISDAPGERYVVEEALHESAKTQTINPLFSLVWQDIAGNLLETEKTLLEAYRALVTEQSPRRAIPRKKQDRLSYKLQIISGGSLAHIPEYADEISRAEHLLIEHPEDPNSAKAILADIKRREFFAQLEYDNPNGLRVVTEDDALQEELDRNERKRRERETAPDHLWHEDDLSETADAGAEVARSMEIVADKLKKLEPEISKFADDVLTPKAEAREAAAKKPPRRGGR